MEFAVLMPVTGDRATLALLALRSLEWQEHRDHEVTDRSHRAGGRPDASLAGRTTRCLARRGERSAINAACLRTSRTDLQKVTPLRPRPGACSECDFVHGFSGCISISKACPRVCN